MFISSQLVGEISIIINDPDVHQHIEDDQHPKEQGQAPTAAQSIAPFLVDDGLIIGRSHVETRHPRSEPHVY